MPMSVTMRQTRKGESGTDLVAGSTYTVSDSFGAFLVGQGFATDTNGALTPATSNLSPAQISALAAGAGNLRPAGAAIVLDSVSDYAPLTITGATTIAISGNTRGAQAQMVVIANGTNVPTVTGADEWASSFGYLNTLNVPNRLDAWYDGVAARYAWSQQMVPAAITVPDVTPPTLSSATVNGASLVLTYSEALNTTAPATSAYSVVGAGGVTQTPSAVAISGAAVTLTLGTPAVNGNAVTVSYTVPGTNPIRDSAGNSAGALSGQAVTNNTTAAGGSDSIYVLTNLSLLTKSGDTYTGQAGTAWTQVGSDGLSLPANGNGYVSVDWPNAANGAVIWGFDTLAPGSGVTYGTCDFVAQLSTAASTLSRGQNTTTNTTIGTPLTPAAGVRYRIGRTGGNTISIDESSDSGATWTTRYTFAATSTAQLYPYFWTIASNTIVNPRQSGLS